MGIISMKRTSMGYSFASSARWSSSFSFSPATGTQLTFTGSPTLPQDARPAKASDSTSRLVSLQYCFASRLSMLTLTPESPAFFSFSARGARWTALLVITTFSMPGILEMASTSSTISCRIRGSPPVMRILRMPAKAAPLQSLTHSSSVSSSPLGRNSCCSSFMQ